MALFDNLFLIKAFLLILSWKIANFQFTKDRAVTKRSCLPIPPQQGVRLYRQGVGWAVYFVNGCLAIPP